MQSALILTLDQSSVTRCSQRIMDVCLKSTASPHLETQGTVFLVHLAFGTAQILCRKEAYLRIQSKLLFMSTKSSKASDACFLPPIPPPVLALMFFHHGCFRAREMVSSSWRHFLSVLYMADLPSSFMS